jgi:hypothetical protein
MSDVQNQVSPAILRDAILEIQARSQPKAKAQIFEQRNEGMQMAIQ